jgi:hypothetical protein
MPLSDGVCTVTRRHNPWVKVGLDAATLGIEASQVVALRMAKLATGGRAAHAEASRMVAEKAETAAALQALAMTGALGFTAPRISSRTISRYRRKVRANRRRLLRSA